MQVTIRRFVDGRPVDAFEPAEEFRPMVYGLDQLEVGDEKFIPYGDLDPYVLRHRLSAAFWRAAEKGRHFTQRARVDGVTVRRVE